MPEGSHISSDVNERKRNKVELNRSKFRIRTLMISFSVKQLDIYYPRDPPPEGKKYPILFYSYLGGLKFESRTLPESNGLIYANFGTFFTTHPLQKYVFVIADHCLVPVEEGGAKFPDRLVDMRDALEFITADRNLDVDPNANDPERLKLGERFEQYADNKNVWTMGHSSGALNQPSLLLHSEILKVDSPLRRKIRRDMEWWIIPIQ